MSDATIGEGTKVTVGLDLGDRHIQVCVLDEAGEVIEEARLATKPQALRRRFSGDEHLRIVLEAGTHSPWVSRLLAELGHEVIVELELTRFRGHRSIWGGVRPQEGVHMPRTRPPHPPEFRLEAVRPAHRPPNRSTAPRRT